MKQNKVLNIFIVPERKQHTLLYTQEAAPGLIVHNNEEKVCFPSAYKMMKQKLSYFVTSSQGKGLATESKDDFKVCIDLLCIKKGGYLQLV